MQEKNDDSIQVCIRIRPGPEEQSLVQYTSTEIHLEKNHFGFDHIFTPDATQDEIFETVGTRVISHTLEGYNGCIFVYGQTGSGKTYTMMGDGNGLMQKCFVRLFEEIGAIEGECLMSCSYYEIYNEQIIDLLDTKKDKKLTIRQDLKKGVFVENLIEESVFSEVKLLECLNFGMRNRHVGETQMNRESSRSHSIFTVSFNIKSEANGAQNLKTPKLHFVDLAGSERQKMTAASGDRLKEAGNINKSLTTLGMVINALASEKSRTHIPYRDSKLTSLLRDSLGGNSKTFLIATISRNILCFQETLSTLNFANRAKMVKVKALVNEESLSTNIEIFKEEIRKLKAEVLRLKSEKQCPTPGEIRWLPKSSSEEVSGYETHFKEINEKINVISDHLAKNSISPSLESLVEQIKILKTNVFPSSSITSTSRIETSCEMIDELQLERRNSQNEEEEDPLIQYLSCNNTLLEKIHTKIDEYLELKEEAKRHQVPISKEESPSKYQQEEYERLLQEREEEIEKLHNQLDELRLLINEQELLIEKAMTEVSCKNVITEEKYEKERSELLREVSTLRSLMKQTTEEIDILNKKYQHAQNKSKENNDLYVYAERNYESERSMRESIEQNLMQKIKDIEQMKMAFTDKITEQKEYYEEMEEGFREEISVLTQTVEFNENLTNEYKVKLEAQKDKANEYVSQIKELEENISAILIEKKSIEDKLLSTQLILHNLEMEARAVESRLQAEVELNREQIAGLQSENHALININNENITKYEEMLHLEQNEKNNLQENMIELIVKGEAIKTELESKIAKLNECHSQEMIDLKKINEEKCEEFTTSIRDLNKNIGDLHASLEQTSSTLNETENSLKREKEALICLQEEHANELSQIQIEVENKLKQFHQISIENEELKNHYKTLQKENYKIKSKQSANTTKTQEELSLKVDYYEEKFKLMSIEYQKAIEVIRKLKEKELNQAERISSLQESHKILKISQQSPSDSELTKTLAEENQYLKHELQTFKTTINKQELTKSYQNRNMIEEEKKMLKEKEDYLRVKIQESINRWDPSKENINKERNFEELINCWEELEAESCKKLEAITKGIKKEQKLKSQNNLILKENIYLKEQVTSLEKLNYEKMGQPRKMVKVDLVDIPEELS